MHPARVLILDDDPLFTRRALLRASADVDIRVCANRYDALQTATAWEPDIIVLDLLLGGTDETALLDQLPDRAGTPRSVVYLSRGTGAATHFVRDGSGSLFGVIQRDAGLDHLWDAVRWGAAPPRSACAAR